MKYLVKVNVAGRVETYTAEATDASAAMWQAHDKYGVCGVVVSHLLGEGAEPRTLAGKLQPDWATNPVYYRDPVAPVLVVEGRGTAAAVRDVVLEEAASLAAKLQTQLTSMRSAFHVNMLRAFPGKSHAEIGAEIDLAIGAAPASMPQPAVQEITSAMLDAGGAAIRRSYSDKWREDCLPGEMLCAYVFRHMLAAAPAVENSAVPQGWRIRDDGDAIVVQHSVIGGATLRKDDQDIPASIFYEFVADVLRGAPAVQDAPSDASTMDHAQLDDAARLDMIERIVREEGYFYIHNNKARYELLGLSIHASPLRDALDGVIERAAIAQGGAA